MVYFAKWKIVFILIVCVLGFAFSTPNFLNEKTAESLPTWLPHKHVSLGLDLQGGSHLLLEVDVNTVIKEQLESLVDSMRVELRKNKVRYGALALEGQTAKVPIRKPEQFEPARSALSGTPTSPRHSRSDS